MKLFLSPHNDDETLFGAFTIQRENPLVVIVFDGYAQRDRGANITPGQRRAESQAAMGILGAELEFLGFPDRYPYPVEQIETRLRDFGQPEVVYAPAVEPGGNVLHNLIGEMAERLFKRVRHYMTYTAAGKSRGVPVQKQPEWITNKLRALACYESQIVEPTTQEHFLRDQYEYLEQ